MTDKDSVKAGLGLNGQENKFQYCSILRVLRVHPVNKTLKSIRDSETRNASSAGV